MSLDLKSHCEHLAALGTKPPSASARRELEEGLRSKWEGAQITAARALAAWGDADSLAAVRMVLAEISAKPARWSAVDAITKALVPHVTPDDSTWILDLYFDHCRKENRFTMMPLLEALPVQETFNAIKARGRKPQQDMDAIQYALGYLENSHMFRVLRNRTSR